jgi:hypothetical protein
MATKVNMSGFWFSREELKRGRVVNAESQRGVWI